MTNDVNDKREISELIKKEMGIRNLTIEKVAEMANIGRATVARTMNSEKVLHVRLESLYKICEALHISKPDRSTIQFYQKITDKYIYCEKEEVEEFPILTVMHFAIYLPLMLDDIQLLFDVLHRIEGRFSGRNSVYELDQLKRLFKAIGDGPMKEYADYLVARTTNEYTEDVNEIIKNEGSEGATLYVQRLDMLLSKSCEIQSKFDELMERKLK